MTLMDTEVGLFSVPVDEKSRVVTLTPSPAIDRVYVVDSLVTGMVNRAARVESYLAGKGINVCRTLRRFGNTTVAVAPMSLEDSLTVLDDPRLFRTVSTRTSLRVNTVIVSRDGSTTNINQPATDLDTAVWSQLCAAAGSEIRQMDAHWLVVAGSMPRESGTRETLHPEPFFREARRAGTRVCLDSGGVTLRRWIDCGLRQISSSPTCTN
jgi:1-phosphofructokinase